MKKAILFLGIIAALIVSVFVIAADIDTVTIVTPATYSTSTATTVFFNWTVAGDKLKSNCTFYNKTALAGNYSLHSGSAYGNITKNNSFGNHTDLLFTDNSRNWVFVSCATNTTNRSNGEIVNSSAIIFDVDTTYDLLWIGEGKVINFSVSTGAARFAGSVNTSLDLIAGGCAKFNCSQTTGCVTLGVCG